MAGQSVTTELNLINPDSEEFASTPEAAPYPSLDSSFWKIKRSVDFIISLAAATVLSPIIVIVLMLVLVDVGVPAIFWQRRVGRGGAPLHLYKFRTLKTLFDRQTKIKRDASDPSIIGRFLRKTRTRRTSATVEHTLRRNVPDWSPTSFARRSAARESLRLTVRPGLTGWAQICGGRLISSEEKNALDEWYIRHASLLLDLFIVLRTLRMLLNGDRRNEKAIAQALLERSQGVSIPHGLAELDNQKDTTLPIVKIERTSS